MPAYDYECFTCKERWTDVRFIAERDRVDACPRCGSFHTRKVPTTANFTVKGFNAKNGYSK